MWRGEKVVILSLWYFPLKVDSVAGFGLMATFLTRPQAPFCSQNQHNCMILHEMTVTVHKADSLRPADHRGQDHCDGNVTAVFIHRTHCYWEHWGENVAWGTPGSPKTTQMFRRWHLHFILPINGPHVNMVHPTQSPRRGKFFWPSLGFNRILLALV